MPITTDQVADWLKMTKDREDPNLKMVVGATNYFVEEQCPDKPMKTLEDETKVWAETTTFAAVMLAARLYNRRNSANGVEGLNEGGATYVARYDPDIARMLRIDAYLMPRVG